MFRSAVLTIPANTLPSAPISVPMLIMAGTIVKMGIDFPTGCAGLARAVILHGGAQVWPLDPGTWIASDGKLIDWQENYAVGQRDAAFYLHAWNIDDTYPHTITWLVNHLSDPGATPDIAPSGTLLDSLRSAFGLK